MAFLPRNVTNAVSIGGAQTGVSASAGPSGWNTIGGARLELV
jgi:allophanate hydrolase subunit 1